MNTPNPLLPQGSLPQRGKSSIYFKVLMIVAIHTVLIGGILMVGCKDASKPQTSATPPDESGSAVAVTPSPLSTNDLTAPPATSAAPVVATSQAQPSTTPTTALVTQPPASSSSLATTPPGVAKEYVIVQGDLLSTIAKKNGVSLKALEDANPGLDPKKLQIGKKLQIPAGTATASTTPTGTVGGALPSDSTAAAGDTTTYTVKSGDVLMRIARSHGTTVSAIESLNDMKTSSIKAGQKLKLPVMKVASAGTTPVVPTAPTTPAATVPATGTATTPATTTY
jgi:LysM repeat protein